jgi:capsular polysaccharide biosynthesis protein
MSRATLPVIEVEPESEVRLAPDGRRAPRHRQTTVLGAARRFPLVVAGCLAATVAVALAFGMTRTPTYTARTQLVVGGINVAAPGALSGYATATVALASTYSRSINENAIAVPVARRLGLPIGAVLSRVSASPIPESPVFRVEATGPTAPRAIELVNAVAATLSRTSRIGVGTASERSRRLRAFSAAHNEMVRAQLRANRLEAIYKRDPSPAHTIQVADARTSAQSASVRAQARRAVYVSAVQADAATPHVTVLAPARGANSDRGSKLQLLLFAGVVAGLTLGLAAALLLDGRDVRRTRR